MIVSHSLRRSFLVLAPTVFLACVGNTDVAPEGDPTAPEQSPVRDESYRVHPRIIEKGVIYENGVERSIEFERVDGNAVVEGDIVLPPTMFTRSGTAGSHWPVAADGYAHVPYLIDSSLPSNDARISAAITEWQLRVKVKFDLLSAPPSSIWASYITFVSGSGCSSPVGAQLGGQQVTLGTGCSIGNAIHEIGHSLGLKHEQNRSDRDTYVSLYQTNYTGSNWSVDFGDATATARGVYDFNSIMHYGSCAFAKSGCGNDFAGRALATILKKDGSFINAQRAALSDTDVNGFRAFTGVDHVTPLGRNASNTSAARSASNLDFFRVRTDGALQTSYWYSGAPGYSTYTMTSTGIGKANTPIAAVPRTANNLDLFFVGTDGGLWTSYWYNGAPGWGTYRIPGTAGTAGSQVAAVSRRPDTIDVFYECGGKLCTAYWSQSAGGWNTGTIALPVAVPAGASITAASRSADHIDVFFVGADGKIVTAYWWAGFGWQSYVMPGTGNIPAGAKISAVARNPDLLDLFAIGWDGVHTSYWSQANGWNSYTIPGTTNAPAGGSIAAVTRAAGNIDYFYVGNDGAFYDGYWYQGAAGWGLTMMSGTGRADPGAVVGASARTANNLDFFVVGKDGKTHTSYWYAGASGWTTYSF